MLTTAAKTPRIKGKNLMGVSYARVKTPLPHILFPARCITAARRSAANIAELPDLLQTGLVRLSVEAPARPDHLINDSEHHQMERLEKRSH